MKHPARTVLSVSLLLAFSGNVPAVNVNDSSSYVNALDNNESIVTVTQDTTLTAQTPLNATVAPGFILEGAYSGSGPTVKLIGGTGSAMAFWSIGADVDTIRNLTFENFIHTISGHDGGAVYLEDGNITGGIHNVHFIGNTSQSHGGALFVYFVNPANSFSGGIHNSSFINNTTQRNGGGADINTGLGTPLTGDLINNRIEGNTALGLGPVWGLGGGMWIVHGLNGDMVDNTVTGNQGKYGGGVALGNLTGNLIGNVFSGNTADVHGGAIYVHDDFVNTLPQGFLTGNITRATFTNNTATTGSGGALYTPVMTGTISDSTFTGNTAGDLGGALSLRRGSLSDVTLDNVRFVGNRSLVSGGALYANGHTTRMTGATFIDNQATGAVLSVMSPTTQTGTGAAGLIRENLQIENSVFLGNTARTRGAAIHHYHTAAGTRDVSISASGGQATVFYGNLETDNARYSALEFSHGAGSNPVITRASIAADANSAVLMLDALQTAGEHALILTVIGPNDSRYGSDLLEAKLHIPETTEATTTPSLLARVPLSLWWTCAALLLLRLLGDVWCWRKRQLTKAIA